MTKEQPGSSRLLRTRDQLFRAEEQPRRREPGRSAHATPARMPCQRLPPTRREASTGRIGVPPQLRTCQPRRAMKTPRLSSSCATRRRPCATIVPVKPRKRWSEPKLGSWKAPRDKEQPVMPRAG